MTPERVRDQLQDLVQRLIAASISVKQSFPVLRTVTGGAIEIGKRVTSSIALRDVPYEEVYADLAANESYDVRLIDGGLLLFQYRFSPVGKLLKHRLAYFPSPVLPSVDEAPELYEDDEIYGDIVSKRLVRFPIRIDFSPDESRDVLHPACHMTLGQYESCRIPISGPLSPSAFAMFVVRNFYCRAYMKNKNTFDRRIVSVERMDCISVAERRITHFVAGR